MAKKAPPKPPKKAKLPKGPLCKLAKKGAMDDLAALAKDAKYLCKKCGRASSVKKTCCKAMKIG